MVKRHYVPPPIGPTLMRVVVTVFVHLVVSLKSCIYISLSLSKSGMVMTLYADRSHGPALMRLQSERHRLGSS